MCRLHVVFGRVVSGHDVVKLIEVQEVDHKNRPQQVVKVVNSGELMLLNTAKKRKKKRGLYRMLRLQLFRLLCGKFHNVLQGIMLLSIIIWFYYFAYFSIKQQQQQQQ